MAITIVAAASATPASTSTSAVAFDTVERRGGLVEDDQLGVAGQRTGHGKALLLAARQLANAAPAGRSETDRVEERFAMLSS